MPGPLSATSSVTSDLSAIPFASHFDRRPVAVHLIVGRRRADGIVEQVYHRAFHGPRESIGINGISRSRSSLKSTLGFASRKFRHSFARQRVHVVRHRIQMRHPRERRKFIDQPLQIFDFANDRLGAFFD